MKFLRNILKGASLTTALFIFQACYGTYNWDPEIDATFKIVSAEDLKPIEGIAVMTLYNWNGSTSWSLLGYSDDKGLAKVYCDYTNSEEEGNEFRFESEDGKYIIKDTLITDFSHEIEIRLKKAE